jgi:TonB family protein
MIEFLVDEEGRARLPRSVTATDEAFAYAAMQAIAGWRFEPPTRGGRAVVVRVQIPMVFGGEQSESPSVPKT